MPSAYQIPSFQIGDRYYSAGRIAADFIRANPEITHWKDGTLGSWPIWPKRLFRASFVASYVIPPLSLFLWLYYSLVSDLSLLAGFVFGGITASFLLAVLVKLTRKLEALSRPNPAAHPLYFMQWQISNLLTIPIHEVTVQLVAKLAQYFSFAAHYRIHSVLTLEAEEKRKELARVKAEEEARERKEKEARKREARRKYFDRKLGLDDDDDTPLRSSPSNYEPNYDDSPDYDDDLINPSSGLPMTGGIGGIDVGGNFYGHSHY